VRDARAADFPRRSVGYCRCKANARKFSDIGRPSHVIDHFSRGLVIGLISRIICKTSPR